MDESTVWNWESNATTPPVRFIPRIIAFLGYNPLPPPKSLPERLLAARKALGLPRRRAAKALGLDEGTLAKLEQGRSRRPSQETLKKLKSLI